MKIPLVVCVVLILFSCKQPIDCELSGFEKVKINKLKFSNRAEKALNKITSILNGYKSLNYEWRNIDGEVSSTDYKVYNVYFKFNEEVQEFYFVESWYRDVYLTNLRRSETYAVPLSEIIPNNIEFYNGDEWKVINEEYAMIKIRSKYDNENAFKTYQAFFDDEGKIEQESCDTIGFMWFTLSHSNAKDLNLALINFAENL